MDDLPRVTDATADVLRVLLDESGPIWGLAVVREAGRRAGTVYPILERLERAGWVESEWERDSARSGPRRRYYRLTADGAHAAQRAIAHRIASSRAAARPVASASLARSGSGALA
ncbi:PadR family transcriptional regulator [Agromyces sp. NPDC055658]